MGICLWLLYPNMSSELECSMWDFIFFIKLFGQSVSQSWCRIPNLLNCLIFHVALYFIPKIKMMAKGDIFETHGITTRNSAIADKPRDAFRGQSRSPNMVLWRKYVRYGFLVVCFSNFVPPFPIFDFRNVVTLKSGSEVTQGHWKWYQSIDWIWFLISVL